MTPDGFSYKYVKKGGDGYHLVPSNSLARQSNKGSNVWAF